MKAYRVAVVIGLFALAVVIGALLGTTLPTTSGARAGAEQPRLGVLSFSCRTEFGFNTCTGEVRNLTNASIKNVTAITSWRDADGAVQRTDEALVDFNPLLAGQTSTFKTIGSANPRLTTSEVRFKELLGGEILTEDDRPQ